VETKAKRALITGITGQDGSLLAELLLEKGYEVTGVARGGEERELGCAEGLRGRVGVLDGDLLDPASLRGAVEAVRPHELYHLAAPSSVPASWERPGEALEAIVGSTTALLEAVRTLRYTPSGVRPETHTQRADGRQAGDVGREVRVFVAASGAMFGDAEESPQSESTPCRPRTPYAIAKLASHQLVGAMREHDRLWACSGILFNHESERGPLENVARTVARGVAQIKLGLAGEVTLGSLQAVRDWSFAGDVMRGAWLMLQQDDAEDYVLASGVGHTVGELLETAFAYVGLEAERHVRIDPRLVRAPEGTPNVGDPTKARERLGWESRVGFEQLVERMVEVELRTLGAVAGPA
jgi:GDPmannose 4,6-dehydratase